MTSFVLRQARLQTATREVASATLLLCALAALSACGGSSPPPSTGPFVAGSPDVAAGPTPTPPINVPPPSLPRSPVWVEDAVPLGRTATFGSFPSDVVLFR